MKKMLLIFNFFFLTVFTMDSLKNENHFGTNISSSSSSYSDSESSGSYSSDDETRAAITDLQGAVGDGCKVGQKVVSLTEVMTWFSLDLIAIDSQLEDHITTYSTKRKVYENNLLCMAKVLV